MRASLVLLLLSAQVALGSDSHEPNPSHPAPAPVVATEPADPAPAAHDAAASAKPAAEASQEVDAKSALQRLVDGNQRYVDSDARHPRADQDRRCLTSSGGQHPFASILSCADSRVPPEILFDAGIGDLFVIRVAGNVADVDEIASLEYGSEHLGSNLIVVMGHSKCGAVTAVVNGAPAHGNLAGLLDNVAPAAQKVKTEHPELEGAALVSATVRANVMQSIQDILTRSPALHEMVARGKVKVVGAVYDIHSGSVQFLGEHPEQAALLKEPARVITASHDEETAPATHADTHGDAGETPAPTKAPKPAEHVDTAHEQHSDATEHAPAKTDPTKSPKPEQTTSAPSRLGPMIAFGMGSVALTGVIVFMLKK